MEGLPKRMSDFPESLERINWAEVVRIMPKRNSPIKRHAPKRPEGFNDPQFRQWVKEWPCFVCLKQHCESHHLPLIEMAKSPEARAYFYRNKSIFDCGLTEFAHVGARGLAQRCADRFGIPLGTRHHAHQTAGGSPESHHTLGKRFWSFHGIVRDEVHELLWKLFDAEVGKQSIGMLRRIAE